MPVSILSPRSDVASAEQIRAAREAAGWTQEQLADALGLLPVEVAAWESGAIALPPHQAATVLWRMETARYEQRLAEASAGCTWLARRRARFDEVQQRGARQAAWVARTLAAHRAECQVCAPAAGALPLPPPRPPETALESWMAALPSRVPPGLRLPVQATQTGVAAGIACSIALAVFHWLGDASAGLHLSPATFSWTALGTAWFVLTHGLLRPLGDRRPYLAGQAWSAAFMGPAVLAYSWNVYLPFGEGWLWLFAALFSLVIGAGLGAWYDPDTERV